MSDNEKMKIIIIKSWTTYSLYITRRNNLCFMTQIINKKNFMKKKYYLKKYKL